MGQVSITNQHLAMDTLCRSDRSEWDWDFGKGLTTIHPQKGMALLHFCSTVPEYGGLCDGNTFHRADPPDPGYAKFVSQQFFASCPNWDIPQDSLPVGRVLSADII
jgi:hypothetical protein